MAQMKNVIELTSISGMLEELEGILAVLERFDELGYEGDGCDEAQHRLVHIIQELRNAGQN